MKKVKSQFVKSVKNLIEKDTISDSIKTEYLALSAKLHTSKSNTTEAKNKTLSLLQPGFLRAIRNQAGYTLKSVATSAFKKPLMAQQLSNAESGAQKPTLAILEVYASIADGTLELEVEEHAEAPNIRDVRKQFSRNPKQ